MTLNDHRSPRPRQISPSPVVSCVVIGGLLLAFGLLAIAVRNGTTVDFDRAMILMFRSGPDSSLPLGPPWLASAVRDVSALGSVAVIGVILLAVLGYLILAGQRASAFLILTSLVGGLAVNSGIKIALARPRPDLALPDLKVFTASFPSGHAALSAIAYLTLAALLAQAAPSRRLQAYLALTGIALTALVGMSRIYLGLHYPTDVLAGWCVGSAWALVCWTGMSRFRH